MQHIFNRTIAVTGIAASKALVVRCTWLDFNRSIAALGVLALIAGIGMAAQAQDGGAQGQNLPPPGLDKSPAKSSTRELKDPTKEGVAGDIKVEALWDGRRMAPFRTLDYPPMVTVAEAGTLDDSDYILGVTAHGESRAYPTRFIWFHHGINDHIGQPQGGGEIPILITYCSVCNTGVCYDPTLNGKPVMLDFYGLYNGVAALCERETQSVFLLAEGRFVAGSLTGARLTSLPMLDTTWGEWKKLHPDTLVMSPETPYSRFYSPKDRPEPRDYQQFPAPFFRPTVTRGDLRLPPFEKVLGVAVWEASKSTSAGQDPAPMSALRRAYPLKTLEQRRCVVNDKLGKTSICVFLDPDTKSAVALSRTLEGRTLTFEGKKQADGKIAYFDRQTHTRWNIEGKAEEGALAGKSLERLDNHLSQWYGWAATFPETTIFGRRDRPKPGDPFDTAQATFTGKPQAPEQSPTSAAPPR